MPSIIEFLEARIAEDEKRAAYYGPLTLGMRRLLAECAAKRAIVEAHTEAGPVCMPCEHEWPCETIRAVASVYKDHPDYQQEWAA